MLAAHELLTQAIAEAIALGDARLHSHAQGSLAALYELEGKRDREALYLTHQAQRAAERAEAPDLLARWYQQAGRILWVNGETDAALASYRRAEELIYEVRPELRARYGASEAEFEREVAPVYLALVDALLHRATEEPETAQASLHEARATVERWKVAALRDYFRDACVEELEALAQSVEEISKTAAAVYPILLPDRLELLVSLPSGIQRHTVSVTAQEVDQVVSRFRAMLRKRTSRQYLSPARQLHAWLVEPYAESLAELEIDTLVFVPDGSLYSIPMAALHDGEGFLIERYAVAVTPSLSLIAPTQLDPSNARILLAGVSKQTRGFPELAFVPGELASIQELYGGEVLLDDSFRTGRLEEELRERPPGIVHLASHMQFGGDARTSFVLTGDGHLTIDQLGRMVEWGRFGKEPLQLLVLSACETAAGDDRSALGLAGVAVRAGARSAIGSLWAVNDQATSELILDFYQELGERHTSKAQALRHAQVALLTQRSYGHPYYWAAFLLINNWL
jgi:CHAT domain-containing protein